MRTAAVVLLILAGALAGLGRLARESEVVILTTYDNAGAYYVTRLWIVDDGSMSWLRATGPQSKWYARLLKHPTVKVERGGRTRGYTAEPDSHPKIVARVNRLMRERYGWVDGIVSALRDPAKFVPIRLSQD